MNELIKITMNENHEPIVSGRMLHEFLQIKTAYKDWFPRMTEYGFVENEDYTPLIFEHPQNKQDFKDHALKLDIAKEICMIQRNDKGKQARQYFIQVEKDFNSPEKIMARALFLADKTINQLQVENKIKDQLIGELKPKADYTDHILSSIGTMTAGQIAADYGLSATKLNKILHEEHIHHKVNNQWILYKEHMGKGYTKSETIPIVRSDGNPDTKMFTKFTQKGRLMINEVLNKQGIYANMDVILKVS